MKHKFRENFSGPEIYYIQTEINVYYKLNSKKMGSL